MPPAIKRILLIILLLLVAALIAYGLYYMFLKTGIITQKPSYPPAPPSRQLPEAGTRAITATGTAGGPLGILPPGGIIQTSTPGYFKPIAITQFTNEFAMSPSLGSGGNLRYYNATDGKFYRVGADGKIKELSGQVFYNASKITWAQNKDKAVIEYPDGSKIVYNFETQKQTTLPKHWEEFSFSPDGTQIAAKSIGLSPENRFLVTTNDDGTGSKIIEPMGENADKVIVDWSPNRQVVAFSQTGEPMGAERREVLFIGLNGENFKSAIVEGLGFEPQWSPTGKELLYSVYSSRSDYKPELWIVNSSGDQIGSNRRLLQLNTWVDKCSFGDDNTLFCAVPRDLPQGAAMAREIANDASDYLYKIDLKTGLKTSIPLNGEYNITNISYDPVNNRVLFGDLNKAGMFEAKL